jgi:hypothetical protein
MNAQITESDWQDALQHWKDVINGIDDLHVCQFCEKFLHEADCKGCGPCPLSLGQFADQDLLEGNCWNPNHPWYAWHHNPTRQNAQAVYDFIAQKYEEWKVKNA